MPENLLKDTWKELDSAELRILLDKRIGGPGQYDSSLGSPNRLYLPLAGSSCRIVLVFRHKKIAEVEPGQAFDASEWARISEEMENSILAGPVKIGREYSFSGDRVLGSWRGQRSGVQILSPPPDAPHANIEKAEHPFIFEFPIRATNLWQITNHRRIREHRRLTLLLNVLLRRGTTCQPLRPECFWATAPGSDSKWLPRGFAANLGEPVLNELSSPATERIEGVEPEEYYAMVGDDGHGLRVPSDLDDSICSYGTLSVGDREKFDRATFWFSTSREMWNISMSAAFAGLVSAIESLTGRGQSHQFTCPNCGEVAQHEMPGAARRFKDFLDAYASGPAFEKRRSEMYAVRSGILHGSDLMQLDNDLAFGCDPPWWNERELYNELWIMTRIALRNWLKKPAGGTQSSSCVT